MATVRSADFLPEIFQTDANKQFLAATLDQLIQEPKFKKTQGYIGRTIGPGVNPNDKYVIEPTKTRADYQLEPGVISIDPTDNSKIVDAITYPGITDALSYQGSPTSQPSRLYASDYYSLDPFIDFDTFVNFSQYYWVPDGPDVVTVQSPGVALSQNFIVNRENGVYTFSGVTGNNPSLNLVRGGNYTFQVAQNAKEAVNYRVTRTNVTSYDIDNAPNASLVLTRGNTYTFNLFVQGDFPFWIKTAPTTGTGDAYNSGVTRNGSIIGTVTFTVPQDAPNRLYYTCQNQSLMQGTIDVIDAEPGDGPGFWIQTNPGISGENPITPNVSSRSVYGVTDNGLDLGTINFNVPQKTAQDFFYSLISIGTVDLVTDLNFDDIDGARLDQFIATYGGIDGITDLNLRTLVFANSVGNPATDYYDLWRITYIPTGSYTLLSLTKIATINNLERFTIRYGSDYSSTQWYKNQAGYIIEMPVLTAKIDTLYYQDGTDPEIFGTIRLIEQDNISTIYIDDILGKKTYTSPNGVTFTNGLKVQFLGNVFPESYATGSKAYVCINTAAGINLITTESTDGMAVGQEVIFTGTAFGGVSTGVTYYIHTVFSSSQFKVSVTPNGPAVTLTSANGTMTATTSQNPQYYVSGVGTAIELLPVENYITLESYASADDIDYLTISRDSPDLNAWSRSNRWFHIDVLNATGAYNDTPVVIDNNQKGKRPIIQFRGGIRLYNMGTEAKQAVNVIDFTETDAFSNVEGSTGYSVNDYTFVDGSRVIFAADEDLAVRSKIYVVNFVVPDTVPPLIAQPIINLVEAPDGEILTDQNTFCLSGTQVGITYWYDGVNWIEAQQKTAVQQAPLFDIYDANGISLANRTTYPSSTFTGTKLFSYATGSGTIDPILQLTLKYLSLTNVGDIVFDNNLYSDTFVYVINSTSTTAPISSGFVYEYASRAVYERLIGWQTAAVPTLMRQQFKFIYDTAPLRLDVAVQSNAVTTVPSVKVFVGSIFQDPGTYTVTTTTNTTTITFSTVHVPGDVIEVEVLSDQISQVAFYQVPLNLTNNPLNANSPSFTLGTLRTHYNSICQNLTTFSGVINGANNTRDLGDIIPYGQIILQQSAPMTLAGYFMRSQQYNIFGALEYNSREYQKYKNQMLEAVTRQTIQYETASQVLDLVIAEITLGRTSSNPFYWSDMLPASQIFTTTTYPVSYTTNSVFDTVQVYNYTSANYLGMNVYLNNRILTRDLEYTVATDGPRIDILIDLVIGDTVVIQEYSATYGTYVPNTPSKMGLYPVWRPTIEPVKTSAGEQLVILGHDGSQTPIFGDIRDEVLLEFETRIYNNIKLDGNPVPLSIVDVEPGQFRNTGYSSSEINTILETNFLTYVGWNKLDYTEQKYNAGNPFTYNYSSSTNKLNGDTLLGAWRGIYRYFYDAQQPELTPWEMLGFTVQPDWWEITYGPAPYTSDNMNLWDDLELGLVRDPAGSYILPAYARPGLTSVLPTDSAGDLLAPLESVVGGSNAQSFQKSWAPGDGGPVEASWWNSSDYPFAVMRLLALTVPAKFFALFADRDLYKYSTEFDQYLYNERYRLDANGVQVYGDGTSKASYINWIVDYNRITGTNSTVALETDLQSLDVRLCYRMASFSDKQYLKIYTEKSSPNSTNSSLQIPPESYKLLVYKNQPFDRLIYSSVVIQVVDGGWAVFGYGTARPFFNTFTSIPVGQFQTYSVAGKTIQVPANYTDTITQIPYGFIFTTESAVANFLLSYGKFLESQGFEFTNLINGYLMTWSQMVYEFIYWAQQGWGNGSLINLNPLATGLSVFKEQAVVDTITSQTAEHLILDQNRRDFPVRDLNIVRINNNFSVQPLNNQSLSFIDMRYTSFESMIVLDNASLFGDLIFEPVTGARQSRLYISGTTTTDWDGSVNAQGFILNQNNIPAWTGLKTYAKGEIVTYKGAYWSAATIVQPSTKFNYNNWNQSDYTFIEQGLLANLANKADQLSNSYDINSANLIQDNDLLSYGLIGFRPRQYMAALNLDDVSQLNIYREFLGTKGSKNSIDLLVQARLNREVADYQVYENWAIQRGVYGANANRRFFDLRLNRALLSSNPSLVQVTLPNEPSTADQQILLSDVWKNSFPLTTPAILPTTTTLPTDISLPSAGYVNINDADITVFDLSDPASISANINSIIVGTSIWVAKINSYDWNIYRAEAVPGTIQHVCDNLNGTSRVIFSGTHGLTTGDRLIIRFFDTEVNGVYTVLSIPNITTVNIALDLAGDRTVVDGTGIGFTLKTMRVAQASDVLNLPYAQQFLPGAKVWVDDNGDGLWEVLQKQNPFTDRTVLAPEILDATEQYGSSVAQATNRSALFVGSPRYGFGTGPGGVGKGGVYLYLRNAGDQYEPISPLDGQDAIITLNTTGLRGYGNAVDAGSQTFAVAGASASLGPGDQADNGYAVVLWRDPSGGAVNTIPWTQSQLLTLPGTTTTTTPGAGEFGYSVAMSLNERWLYVGAPGLNTVYAYGQVLWEDQFLQYKADGTSNTVNISSDVQVDNLYQLVVTKNNALLVAGVGYTISSPYSTLTFTSTPALGDSIYISRRYVKTFTAAGTVSAGSFIQGETYTISFVGSTDFMAIGAASNTIGVTFVATDIGSGSGTAVFKYALSNYLFTADNIYSFSVSVSTVLQRPNIDYTFSGGTLTFYTVPSVGASVSVTSENYYQLAGTITPSVGVISGARFGSSVQCSTDGRQVIIGCSKATVDGLLEAGSVYVVDRNVQKFIVSNAATTTYTVLGTVTAPVSVLVNNIFLVNQTDSVLGGSNTFSVSGNNITINQELFVGDVIEIEINQFVEQQLITENTVAEYTNYGQSLDLCPYNCSLYVGAPQDSSVIWRGGVVERSVNQARTYGTITATVANPSLTAGQTLRVNNVDIVVPVATGTVSSLQGLANNINTYAPNATATVSAGYLTISVRNSEAAATGNKLQVAPGSTGTVFSALGFDTFVYTQTISSPRPTTFAQFGYSVAIDDTALNLVVGSPRGSLYLPMVFDYNTVTEQAGTTFDGNSTTFFSSSVMVSSIRGAGSFVIGQQYTIVSVGTTDFTSIGATANTVGIRFTATGAGSGTGTAAYYLTRLLTQSGVVYTYDYLPSNSASVADPGKFIFGQQVETNAISYLDQFGYAVSYNSGVLVATAPGEDFEDSTLANPGAAYLFENSLRQLAWQPIAIQQPVVDIRLLTSVYMYDRITSAKTHFFDFFDPLQGKVLGAAQENIDYISAIDPASYNVGPLNNRGDTWSLVHLGEVWWDISTVRFIDPNQDNPTYASRRWGQVFPGSRVDIYQWISSSVPPANYTGVGVPYSINSYVINTRLNQSGTFVTEYYFWVRGITETASQAGKTLSVATVASYIQEPRSSGISYIAPINSSTIAIYNALDYIVASDTIISVEFDQVYTEANVHTEYELIAQGQADSFLSGNLYRKLQDSFCGVDTTGNKVPDPNLNYAQRYGVQFRPRQSMFVDRFLALQNYIQRANDVFALYPITEIRNFNLLNSAEPEPAEVSTILAGEFQIGQTYTIDIVGTTNFVAIGASSNTVGVTFVATGVGSGTGRASYTNWNFRVANLEILGFQDIYAVPLGYKYLVATNSLNRGLWTINEVQATNDPAVREIVLSRVQNYDTRQYWSHVNWYQPGYNSSSTIVTEVPNYATLTTLNVAIGSSVKVTANAQGKFEIYLRTDAGWDRVGLEDGTIEISAVIYDYALGRYGYDLEVFDAQYYDQEPVIETRNIIQAINEELFVGELKIERNKSLTLMFNFILSELLAPEWLIKTSLIDVQHKVRDLVPYQNYIRDNQEFVSDYIQEVKPYHVQVREFNLTYDGMNDYLGDLSDFDLPAYYNTDLTVPQFVSPILLPYQRATAQAFNTLSDTAPNSTLWDEWPYSQWFNNYLLEVGSITVTEPGSGYTIAPTVLIVPAEGDTGSGAEAVAVLNSLGQIVSITVIKSGYGYRSTPTVVFDGGNGTSARAYPVMIGMGNAINQATNQSEFYNLVRSFKTVIKYDRYQYQTSVLTWSTNGTYENGTLVRYDNRVWQANSIDGSSAVVGPTFNLEDWTLVDAATLSGVNRTMGFYVPGVNELGLDLNLLVDGTSYPGVQVWGDYFLGSAPVSPTLVCTATNATTNEITCTQTARLTVDDPIRFYGTVFGGVVAGTLYYINAVVDSTRFTISLTQHGLPVSLTTATGTMIADVPEPLDAVYASSFSDLYLGVRPTDINVDGGEFIGPYEGYAPEELVNGSEYDTLDFRVYTRPGADWLGRGHGFAIGSFNYVYDSAADPVLSWKDLVQHPVNIEVSNETTDLDLTPDVDYVVNWANQTITAVEGGGITSGDIINIAAYEMGGGNQLFRGNYDGSDASESVIIPVKASEIYELVLFVNGLNMQGATWAPYVESTDWSYLNTYATHAIVNNDESYYRALQAVPAGILIDNLLYWEEFVPTTQSLVRFPHTITNVKYATTESLFGDGYIYNNGVNGVGATLTKTETISALSVDGVTPSVGDYILVKNETGNYVNNTTPSEAFNGIYRVIVVGNDLVAWVIARVTEFDGFTEIPSSVTLVTSGVTNIGTQWVCTTNPRVTVGTTLISWTRFFGEYRSPFVATDGISITAMGFEDPQHSWSTATTQHHTATLSDVLTNSINLDNSMQGTNVANIVVTVNGRRLQPPEGIEWIGDGTSSSFGLPKRGGYSETIINPINDVQVWLNNVLQVQNFGATVGDYYVTNYNGNQVGGRQVVFFTPPADGAQILISVSTIAQYSVVVGSPSRLLITPLLNEGDQIAVTSWNDTSQQNALTLVFVGPVTTGIAVVEPYDSTNYDPLFVADTSTFTGTYPAGQFIVGNTYTILTAGTTNFVALGAANNNPGTVFVATGSGAGSATGLVSGQSYTINYVGTTDWTLLGAASSTFGTTFTANATGTGLGTGTAVQGTGTATGTITTRALSTNNYNNTAGSFDFGLGVLIPANDFNLGRDEVEANRLWVTLDGYRLYSGVDYSVQGQYLILGSGVISQSQVLVVTEFTESIVPEAMAFRLFQDMRGVQTTFRITAASTTAVAQTVSATANTIYVTDVSALSEPALSSGIFGVVTINGERILYRLRDLATNSISGLQRGTAGTGAATHSIGSEVYDMGIGNRQAQEDQNYIVSDTSTGDGSTTIFYAPSIEFDLADSSVEIGSIEVYVGGNRARVGYYAGQFAIGQTYTIASIGNTDWYAIGLPSDVYPAPGVVFTATGVGSGTGVAGTSLASNYYKESEYDPLSIQFLTASDLPAPGPGVDVVILQRRGVTWYAPGINTPSNGEPLQITETLAARFLRGL